MYNLINVKNKKENLKTKFLINNTCVYALCFNVYEKRKPKLVNVQIYKLMYEIYELRALSQSQCK